MKKITLSGISKSFGGSRALENVDLTFESGKIYGLLGRNGAGKTTLLKILYGILYPSSGRVLSDDKEIRINDNFLGHLFYVGEPDYFPVETSLRKLFSETKYFRPEFDTEYALSLTSLFGLDSSKSLRSLSTGQRTLFKDILALSSGASFIFLDEPILGLDANRRDILYRTILGKYNESPFTIVISTHLIEEISSIVEHVIILHEGRVVRDEPLDSLLASGYSVSGKKDAVRKYISGKSVMGIDALGGFECAYILGARQENGHQDELEFGRLSLQKIFVQMTGSKGGDDK